MSELAFAEPVSPTADRAVGIAGGLAGHGERLALVAPDGTELTYRQLADRVCAVVERLGPVRRLVLLAARNDVESVVAYLAALRGGHVVLPTAPGQVAALTAAYDPDVVAGGEQGWTERRPGTAHELHPELALLLSTSGSTGSPKLVRLSAAGLVANAAAIAEYLDIRATDRAITSLPMHYCYGLSVLNSNLLRGAGVVLSDRSVVDPAFWAAVREHGVTSVHGVPHTFDLLDSVGFADLDVPSLRYVTQAGGRLEPTRVARYAELGESRGWRLFVMYGQTEATARIAYLPPELARTHPGAIGVPVPGGQLDVAADGELVYRGPNVMLGYASSPADLALGRTVTELRTGDLARRTPDGLFELTGRRSRFLKLFGLRIDLDHVERMLAEGGIEATCAGTDEALVVAVRGSAPEAAELVRGRFGLPAGGVRVREVAELPLLPNGKPDHPAVARLADPAPTGDSVRQAFAAVLGLRDVPGDASFLDLGGDSLTYVRMSIALQRLLGDLPQRWPTMTVADLERRRRAPGRLPMIETSIVLRALAIVLVVGSHIALFDLPGGAHLLLVIAGWNFARFLLPAGPARMARAALVVAVPAAAWLAYRLPVTDDVNLMNVLLVNNFVHTGAVGYWFVEVLVHALLVLAVVLAVAPLRRLERAHGFGFALAVLGVALAVRATCTDPGSFFEHSMTTLGALWCFVLGWLAHRAATSLQKCAVAGIALVLVPDAFDHPSRVVIVLAGLAVLIATTRLPVPRPAVAVVGLVASASLYIYLTHYAVFPLLLGHLPMVLVLLASLAAGVLTWRAVELAKDLTRRFRPRRGPVRPTVHSSHDRGRDPVRREDAAVMPGTVASRRPA